MILLYIINDTYHPYISMYMRYDGLWCVQAHPSIFVQPYTFSGQPAVFQAMLAQDRAMIEQLQRKPPRESAVRKKPPTPPKVSQRVVPIRDFMHKTSEQLRREQILGWRKLAKHLDDIPGVGVLEGFINRTRTLVFHQQLRFRGRPYPREMVWKSQEMPGGEISNKFLVCFPQVSPKSPLGKYRADS
jgi:hypothetical protein